MAVIVETIMNETIKKTIELMPGRFTSKNLFDILSTLFIKHDLKITKSGLSLHIEGILNDYVEKGILSVEYNPLNKLEWYIKNGPIEITD